MQHFLWVMGCWMLVCITLMQAGAERERDRTWYMYGWAIAGAMAMGLFGLYMKGNTG